MGTSVGTITIETGPLLEAANQAVDALKKIQDQVKQTGEGAHEASAKTNELSDALLDVAKKATAGFLGFEGLAHLYGFIKDASLELETSQNRLAATFETTSGRVGLSLADLRTQADELSHVTMFSPEQVQDSESRLMTFQGIAGTTFQRATRDAADMATAMGSDMTTAARMLGRALEDPEHGMMMMQRAGVAMTAAQRENILELSRQNDLYGAQTAILGVLESNIGGLARKMDTDLVGSISKVKTSLTQLGASIFDMFKPYVITLDLKMSAAADEARHRVDYGDISANDMYDLPAPEKKEMQNWLISKMRWLDQNTKIDDQKFSPQQEEEYYASSLMKKLDFGSMTPASATALLYKEMNNDTNSAQKDARQKALDAAHQMEADKASEDAKAESQAARGKSYESLIGLRQQYQKTIASAQPGYDEGAYALAQASSQPSRIAPDRVQASDVKALADEIRKMLPQVNEAELTKADQQERLTRLNAASDEFAKLTMSTKDFAAYQLQAKESREAQSKDSNKLYVGVDDVTQAEKKTADAQTTADAQGVLRKSMYDAVDNFQKLQVQLENMTEAQYDAWKAQTDIDHQREEKDNQKEIFSKDQLATQQALNDSLKLQVDLNKQNFDAYEGIQDSRMQGTMSANQYTQWKRQHGQEITQETASGTLHQYTDKQVDQYQKDTDAILAKQKMLTQAATDTKQEFDTMLTGLLEGKSTTFRSFIDSMIQDLDRLLAKLLATGIEEQLIGFLPSGIQQLFGVNVPASGGGTIQSLSALSAPVPGVAMTPMGGQWVPGSGAGGGGTVVHLSMPVTVHALDGADATSILTQHAPIMAGLVVQQITQSRGLSTAIARTSRV